MSSTLVQGAARAAVALSVIGCWGLVFTLCAPTRLRRLLVPALPATGAATIVALHHWLNPFMTARTTDIVLTVGGVAALVALVATRRRDLGLAWRDLLVALMLALVAMPGVMLTVKHLAHAEEPGLAFTSPVYDAFFHTAVDDWLVDHTTGELPRIGHSTASPDGPADVPMRSYEATKRWGEASLQTMPTAVLGGRTSQHWALLTACWLLLLPGAIHLLLRGWGARRGPALWGAAAGGALTTAFATVLYAVLNQNGSYVLGLSLLVAAVGMLGVYLRQRRAGTARADLALAALASIPLIGWIGTYFELAAVGVPLVIAVVLTNPRVRTASFWRSFAMVTGCTWVLGAIPIVNAVNGSVTLNSAKAVWPSYFLGGTVQSNVARVLGLRPVDLFEATPIGAERARIVLVAVLWLLTVAVALLWRPARWSILLTTAMVGGYWYTQSRGDTNYTANRLVLMLTFAVAMLSASGAATFVAERLAGGDPRARRLGRTPPEGSGRPAGAFRFARIAVFGVFGVLYLATVTNSWHVVTATVDASVPGHQIIGADAEAAGWVQDLGGRGGREVQVVTTHHSAQLVLLDLLRELPDVSWASLFPAYPTITSFDAVDQPKYVLTDEDALVVGRPTQVHGNERWVLYELAGPSAVVSGPSSLTVSPSGPQSAVWSFTNADAAVALSPACAGFPIALSTTDGSTRTIVTSVSDNADVATATPLAVGPGPTPVPVTRTGDGGLTLRLASADRQPVSLEVTVPAACGAA